MDVYEKYSLSSSITVQELVSADYILGPVPDSDVHSHDDAWELCCCLHGQLHMQKATDWIRLRAGEVLFIPPETDHNVDIQQKDCAAFLLSFTCSGGSHLKLLQDGVVSASGSLLTILHNIREELEMCFVQDAAHLHLQHFVPSQHSPFGAEQMISCYLEQFIIQLLRSATMEQGKIVSSGGFTKAAHRYLADQVLQYIQNHLGEHLTVESIAAYFHYSRARLTAICKQATGMGINELITHTRIQTAKRMLLEQQHTVAQISRELGFSSPHYFSYKFKQVVGCAPSDYAESKNSL